MATPSVVVVKSGAVSVVEVVTGPRGPAGNPFSSGAIATEEEAIAGSASDKLMTPQRTAQAIESSLPRRKQIVATRGYLPGTPVSGTYILTECRAAVKIGPSDVSDVQVAFVGFSVDSSGGGEQALPNDITVVAAVEKVSPGVAVKGTLGAKTVIEVEGGAGIVLTDPIGLDFAANEIAKVQIEQRLANATDTRLAALNFNVAGSAVDVYRSSSLSEGQVGTAGTWSSTDRGSNQNVMSHTALIGIPNNPFPSCVIIGDSIAAGRDDSNGDAVGNHGYIPRGLYDGGPDGVAIPYANLARSGEKLSTLAGGGYARRLVMLQYATHAICNLGINDISGSSLGALQAGYAAGWASIKRRGVKLYQCLIGPRTTGTFTDAAGQTHATGHSPGGLRDQINDWIVEQAAAGVIDGYIDPNPYIEDPDNPGKWLPNLTADGIHPNDAAHALMAQAVRSVTVLWVAD
jgi:lysophospholipase L1-like esterase